MNNLVSCVAIDIINADKPPASLAFLAGICEKLNLEYSCHSLNVEMFKNLDNEDYQILYNSIKMGIINANEKIDSIIDKVINEISLFSAPTLLVTVFSFMQVPIAKYFLKRLRSKLPNIEIIAGGPGIANQSGNMSSNVSNGRLIAQDGLIDYYVLGEGDEILPSFLKGERNLIGLNTKDGEETWVPQIADLDSAYIFPSYKKIDIFPYKNLENKKAVLSLNTSRGCVRNCTFCDVARIWPKFRYRSGKNIAQEVLKHYHETKIVNYTIVDSLINGSMKSFREFNEEIIKLKQEYPDFKNFSYNGMFIVRSRKTHNEEFFKLMSDAGCESISIGVESGSEKLRYEIDKRFTDDDLDYHFEMCQKYKIRNNLLMFVGYPSETREDFEMSLKLLDKYQKYLIDDTIIGINFSGIFSLLKDTPIYDHRDELNLEVVNDSLSNLNWVKLDNPDLTVKERINRDLTFRKHAAELRYPIPYNDRYLQYLKEIDKSFVPLSD